MTENERYEFDRQGFLVLRNFLTDEEVSRLRPAIDTLEQHAMDHYQLEPRKSGHFGSEYHFNAERGYHVTGDHQYGQTFIIEDFFNFDSGFDFLVNHPRTNSYISSLVQEEIPIIHFSLMPFLAPLIPHDWFKNTFIVLFLEIWRIANYYVKSVHESKHPFDIEPVDSSILIIWVPRSNFLSNATLQS